ncbi:MAG TPA: hypothetical protein VMS21_12585 [Methylomirabilota bacterium]|nr:hypothetical protein [Methylomirabilota bacterium]
MSRINDALKRASRTMRRMPRSTVVEESAFKPVSGGGRSRGWSGMAVPLLAGVVLTMSMWLLWRGFSVGDSQSAGTGPAFSIGAEVPVEPNLSDWSASVERTLDAPATTSTGGQPFEQGWQPFEPRPDTRTASRTDAPSSPPFADSGDAPAIDAEPGFPELKLQAVFYRHRNPSVLINNRALFVGDSFEGVRIERIDREGVLVEWRGRMRVLRTGQSGERGASETPR